MSSDVALMKCLEAEKEKISAVMDYIQNNVGKYPDEKLYVSISKGNEQYYYLDSKKDESGKKKTNGKYIWMIHSMRRMRSKGLHYMKEMICIPARNCSSHLKQEVRL